MIIIIVKYNIINILLSWVIHKHRLLFTNPSTKYTNDTYSQTSSMAFLSQIKGRTPLVNPILVIAMLGKKYLSRIKVYIRLIHLVHKNSLLMIVILLHRTILRRYVWALDGLNFIQVGNLVMS